MSRKKIFVTKPSLPPLDEFNIYLEKIWKTRQLTNTGPFHKRLEKELKKFLGVDYISLTVNGTTGLLLALKALKIIGEVITTPFSFVATTHVLGWNNLKPVFVDIEPEYFNIDPDKIREAVTKKTTAIMPVHVFGNPCRVQQIDKIAKEFNLKVIYDSSHAFGVTKNNKSILNYGDLSVLSFHATKAFNTFEGGAVVSHDEKLKRKIDRFSNHGFVNETTIKEIGINGKMNEFQAALGLLQLKYFQREISLRKYVIELYKEELSSINGISFVPIQPEIKNNLSYFPIIIDPVKFGVSRDTLYDLLKLHNIYTRRYFYPLISNLSFYNNIPSASKENLPVANKIASQILCLPVYSDLNSETVRKVIKVIKDTTK